MAFSLMHGNTSYTRCCNVAVYPLVGDVVGATVVLNCCGFAARYGALEPEVKLQDVRLGAAVLSDGWRRLSLVSVSLGSGLDSFVFRRR